MVCKAILKFKEKPKNCAECKVCNKIVDQMSEDDNIIGECRIIYKNNFNLNKDILDDCPIKEDSSGYYIRFDLPNDQCRGCKLCIWTGYLEDNNVEGKCLLTGNTFTINQAEESRDKECPLMVQTLWKEYLERK